MNHRSSGTYHIIIDIIEKWHDLDSGATTKELELLHEALVIAERDVRMTILSRKREEELE